MKLGWNERLQNTIDSFLFVHDNCGESMAGGGIKEDAPNEDRGHGLGVHCTEDVSQCHIDLAAMQRQPEEWGSLLGAKGHPECVQVGGWGHGWAGGQEQGSWDFSENYLPFAGGSHAASGGQSDRAGHRSPHADRLDKWLQGLCYGSQGPVAGEGWVRVLW